MFSLLDSPPEGAPMRPETVNNTADPLCEAVYRLTDLPDGLTAVEAVRVAHAVQFAANDVMPSLVKQARTHGATWDQIAQALGVTRSAAHQRYSQS